MKLNSKLKVLLGITIISTGLLVGCGSNESSEGEKEETTQGESSQNDESEKDEDEKEEQVDASNMNVVGSDWEVNLLAAETVSTWTEGETALKLTYDFTNNSEENAAPFLKVNFKMFQDGIELSSTSISDDIDLGLGQRELQPEAYMDKAETGQVITSESPVQVIVEDLMNFTDESYAEFSIDPTTLEITRVK